MTFVFTFNKPQHSVLPNAGAYLYISFIERILI